MKLKVYLKALPADTLRSIGSHWNLKLPAAADEAAAAEQVLADFLYPRLQSIQYFRGAFDRLTDSEKEILNFVAAHGGVIPFAELMERCNGCGELVTGLHSKGFLFLLESEKGIKKSLVTLPDAYMEFYELPSHLRGYLGELLRSMPSQGRAEMAENILGTESLPDKKHLVIHEVRSRLLNPEFLRGYVDSLAEVERELFHALFERNGTALYRELLDLESLKRFDHSRAEHLNNLINLRGLVFVSAEGQNKYTNLLVIPRDLFHTISTGFKRDLRSPRELDDLGSEDHGAFRPAVVVDNSNSLLRDLVILASAIDSAKLKKLSAGGISRNDLKKLLPVLSAGKSLRYSAFLASFLLAKELLIELNGCWALSNGFHAWLQDARTCYHELAQWWATTQDWFEGAPEGSESESSRGRRNLLDILQLRRLVLEEISALPAGRWILCGHFLETIMPRVEAALSHLATNRKATRLQATISTVLECIIGESLAWLGVVSLGLKKAPLPPSPRKGRNGGSEENDSRKRGTDFVFRKTSLGVAALDSTCFDPRMLPRDVRDESLPVYNGSQMIIVQPNLEIVAPPDLALDKLLLLTRCCFVRNNDVMTTFEISRDSLRGALDRGMRGEEVLKLLKSLSRVDIPRTVQQLIDDCTVRHGEVRLGPAGGFVLVDDPVVLEEIRSSSRLADYIRDAIGDKALLLAPEVNIPRMAKELQNLGLMPRLETETVHATTDERYHLTLTPEEMFHMLASVRLVARLEQELGSDISDGNVEVLARKLNPDTSALPAFGDIKEATAGAYERKFEEAFKARLHEVADKYKTQVSRLVGKTLRGRGPSKYHYKGANPAVEKKDIIALLTFACEHELEVEVLYLRQNDQEAKFSLSPKSFEGGRLYAHCSETDSDSMYAPDRILRAKLL
ncbi:MAG: helicase-associated domain-containing protein [Candidatus Sumerlaeaceae bacterium]|nr:helicase-associated domain-containing protein [Candidatus Sumerlaeaceae bacterium]